MANKTDERLLDSFREASGGGASGRSELPGLAEGITGALKDVLTAETNPETAGARPAEDRGTGTDALWAGMRQDPAAAAAPAALEHVKAVMDAQLTGLTQAVGASSTVAQGQTGGNLYVESGTAAGSNVHSSSGGGTNTGGSNGSSAESVATGYFGGGGILSLIGGLIGLFGGGASAPPDLEKYAMPSPISFSSAETGSGLSASDFDQMGAPRMYSAPAEAPAAAGGGVASSSLGGPGGGTSGSAGNTVAPQISVTVQTMDAQSFLDHSDQIAKAVRGAMLNLSSINDVVGEL